MNEDEVRQGYFASFETKERVHLKNSKTFAQAGMECCDYVKKYGKCYKIELLTYYN